MSGLFVPLICVTVLGQHLKTGQGPRGTRPSGRRCRSSIDEDGRRPLQQGWHMAHLPPPQLLGRLAGVFLFPQVVNFLPGQPSWCQAALGWGMGRHRYFLKSGVLFYTTILNLFLNSVGFLLLLHSPVLSLGYFLQFVVVCFVGFLCGRHELGSPTPPSCWHHSPEYFCVIVQGNTEEEKPPLWFVFEPDLSFSTTLTKVVLKSSLIDRYHT